jgi:hypothetical protein
MADYTSLGAQIWRWRRWRNLDATTRLFWLGLYTSLHAKRMVPGLWHGSIPIMVDETGFSPEHVIRSVDRLLEADLIEYDRDTEVIRMTELPDAGEWPSNEMWLKGWWNRFTTVPACAIRDAHVTTLRWILDRGAKDRGKVVSNKVEQVWLETFGRIDIPTQRRRGISRLEGDSDTSTAVQPSLFSAPSLPPRPSPQTDSITSRATSDQIPFSSENVSEATSEERVSRGSLDPLRPSGTGIGTGTGDGSSSPGGSGGLSTGRPKLVLIPGPGPFEVDALHALFARWPYWPKILSEDARLALGHAIAGLTDLAREHDVFALLRERIERKAGEISRAGPEWLAAPGRLIAMVHEAIALARDSAAKSAALAEALANAPK